jgi:hypothetical protein
MDAGVLCVLIFSNSLSGINHKTDKILALKLTF